MRSAPSRAEAIEVRRVNDPANLFLRQWRVAAPANRAFSGTAARSDWSGAVPPSVDGRRRADGRWAPGRTGRPTAEPRRAAPQLVSWPRPSVSQEDPTGRRGNT